MSRVFPALLVSLAIGQQASAQAHIRSAMPARPHFNVPQVPQMMPQANPFANNPAALNNSMPPFLNSSVAATANNWAYNEFGINPWNSGGYGNWNSPFMNSYFGMNSMYPAMNNFWGGANWQTWNNPYLYGAMTNQMWNNYYMNSMWNNFAMNSMWNSFNFNPMWNYNPFMYSGMPVGNWNWINPIMPVGNNGAANNANQGQ